MKQNIVFILIFFLVFSLQFKLVSSLSTGHCRYYINGICQTEGVYYPEETVSQEEEIKKVNIPYSNFVILVLQLVGIIVLFILLVVIIQSLTKSKRKKV